MPAYLFTLYTVPLVIAVALSLGIAIYAWTQRRAHSALALCWMATSIAIWTFAHIFEVAGTTLAVKILWGKINNIGIMMAPVTWLIFAIRHTSSGKPIAWRWVALLMVMPLVTLGVVFTNEAHHLFWSEVVLVQAEGQFFLRYTFGPWFGLHMVYSYALISIGAVLLVLALARREGAFRSQAVALLIAVFAPWVSNILFLTGLNPFPNIDLTPFAFTITVVALAWAIFGSQLVNLSPLARDLLVDSMTDGMIILDGRGRVADINPAAGRMIGVAVSQAIGKPAADIFAPWPDLIEHLRELKETHKQITVGEGEARRSYELHLSPLHSRQGQPLGHLMMLQDVSEGGVPPPRYAPLPIAAQPPEKAQPSQPAPRPVSPLTWLFDFVRVPTKTDLPTPPEINPQWYQARERSFTLVLRIAGLVGSLAWFIAPSFSNSLVGLPFAIIIAIFWLLGLARQIRFEQRAATFLVVMYALAFTETYSFGYSVESAIFFLTLIILSTLLLGRKGSISAFTISVVTLGIFGIQIGRGAFVPPATAEGVLSPASLSQAVIVLLTFTATSLALLVSTLILTESLNRAWQLETQALNLLQQERDLLEVRVQERTHELAEARDDALKNRDELRKYFLVIEQSGNTIVITDPQGQIEYINPRFTALTGYTSEEAIGQNPRIVKSGKHNREFYQELWEAIRSGQTWHGEFHNRRKDGSLFWELATIAPMINPLGETTHYVAIKEDITAQKELQEQLRIQNEQMAHEIVERIHAEARLQENEARFRQIVENASDIICRISPTGYLTYVNPTGLRTLGYQEHEVIGRHYLELIAPEFRHKTDRFYKRQVFGKIPTTYQEFLAITGDGREIWMGQNVQSIMKDDQVVELQTLARDITERKRFEDALALARDQAIEASQVKSQLLSKVNHELRTPLGGILGFAELLRTGTFGTLTQEQDQALSEIMDSVNYLTGIVNELLDTAQIEARKLTLRSEPCSPFAILKQVETQLAVLASKKGILFTAQAAPDLPETILGDERRLKQIAINLAGNAIKFTQAGEVRLKMFCPDAGHWAIQVSDTGIGIPLEEQSQIFEPFRQLQDVSTRDHRGTGLGLSITRQLVELMNGEISLESEPGRGSTFTAKLPIHNRPELVTRPLVQRKEISS